MSGHMPRNNLERYAEHELELLGDGEMRPDINNCIMKLVRVFAEQGHSGLSGNYTINVLARLLKFRPLSPIEDRPEDWLEHVDGMYQHKRYGSVFRAADRHEGRAYDMDAEVFSDDGGETWFTNSSYVDTIEFPYTVPSEPKRYLIECDANNNIISKTEYTR